MERIRKRSFTDYKILETSQEDMLDSINQQSQNSQIESNLNLQKKQNREMMSLGLIRSKKLKLFKKYQNFNHRTSRTSQQTEKISTIQSLKRQVLAIQNQEVLSYRVPSIKQQLPLLNSSPSGPLLKNLSFILKKTETSFSGNRFQRRIDELSTRRQAADNKRQQIGLLINQASKLQSLRTRYLSQKAHSSSSLSARRFYKRSDTTSKSQSSLNQKNQNKQQPLLVYKCQQTLIFV